MKSKVWFTGISENEAADSVGRKLVKLAGAAGLSDMVQKDALIGILQHVGEGRGIGFIKPGVTAAVAQQIERLGGKPFLTGSATLYRGRRSNARDHIAQAYEHGFTPEVIHCPMVMSDGLLGADMIEAKAPGAQHCKIAYLGSAAALMGGLVAISHPTGHDGAGFAASIKNVAMGLASRGGKLAMHHGSYPEFQAKKCTACGKCAEWCPENAIVMEKTARLLPEKCVGCGQCYSVCNFGAIDFRWIFSGAGFQERLVDYCVAVKSLLGDNMLYANVIQHFQANCDCVNTPQKAVCPDVGIVVSRDIVAVDAAAADLLVKASGRDIVLEAGKHEYKGMFEYAEKLGLGSRKYDLVELR